LFVALLPLAWSLLGGKDDAGEERLSRTIGQLPPEVQQRIHRVQIAIAEGKADEDALFLELPGNRLEGAHLARHTFIHYLYALLSAGAFLGLARWMVPGKHGRPLSVVLSGVFTATVGIVFLLVVQFIAELSQYFNFVSGSGIITLFFWIIKGIGFSYRAALDPDTGFIASFLGFTFGVGLCEEMCKAIPLIVYYRVREKTNRRESFAWGFASGAGFGVAEGIMYSASYYNGVAYLDTYLVRFLSCVALHATWTGSVALFMHKFRANYHRGLNAAEVVLTTLFLVAVPTVLHGLYDAALKKDMDLVALVVGLASFGWLAWCAKPARRRGEAMGTA
jgi:RsiW-degrading membrane proteinase PrsW (M82 family)